MDKKEENINKEVDTIHYYNPIEYLYLDQKRKLGLVKRIQKQINKFKLSKDNFIFKNTNN